jgi:hypothetical protein
MRLLTASVLSGHPQARGPLGGSVHLQLTQGV